MKIGALASLSGIAAITVLGATYLTFGVVRVDPLADYTEASLEVADSGGLSVGSPILLTGIEIGEVTAVDTDARGGVRVGFRVGADHKVPMSSIVTIEHLSSLGEPYVQFVPPSTDGPYLTDGQRLAGENVRTPMSIPEVARLVTKTVEQLDPTVVDSLVGTLGTAMTGTENVIPELARAGDLLAAAIMSRAPAIAELQNNFEYVSGDIAWAGPATSAAAPAFVRLSQVIDQFVESVGRATEGDPEMYLREGGLVPVLNELVAKLNEIGPELSALLPALRPLTEAVTATGPQLDLSALVSQALHNTDADSVKVRVAIK
ncbi:MULTISPECIES: MlaD family protein [Nocardia]|uniref:Virulence factor Mce-like protein n=2 Tax=Nocardia TaxID=1817 RepID=A0A4R6NXT3_NOCIG|nr:MULTISPECIES: MlaD family protein [Nocardia]NKX91441.1 MCE family protein [Nocardia coubleae]TDP29026.1 virulence factor Mce-like protein [Nocardia ignorata]